MIYEIVKHFTSFLRLNRFKITLRSISKLFELWKLKYFSSFQILHRFVESLSFFCKKFKVWNIANGFIDEISFRKVSNFETSYASFGVDQIISSFESVCKNWVFSARVSKYETFQMISYTKSVSEKFQILNQATGASKLLK